jgi:hypothetical protein
MCSTDAACCATPLVMWCTRTGAMTRLTQLTEL